MNKLFNFNFEDISIKKPPNELMEIYSLFNSKSVFITEPRSDEQIVSKFKLAFENFLFVFYHSGRLNGVDNSFCAFEFSKSTIIIIPTRVVVCIILSEVDYARYNLYR